MAEFFNVDEVLHYVHATADMLGAEFGCGSAVFTLKLAKKLHKGKVYAMDVQEEKLSALQGKAALAHIGNISTIHCNLEEPGATGLQSNMLDIVLIPNVLFQAENKYAMIEEAVRILKSGGQLLIIDWLKKGKFSPKEGMISPDEVKKMAGMLGVTFKKEFSAGDYHYALSFVK